MNLVIQWLMLLNLMNLMKATHGHGRLRSPHFLFMNFMVK